MDWACQKFNHGPTRKQPKEDLIKKLVVDNRRMQNFEKKTGNEHINKLNIENQKQVLVVNTNYEEKDNVIT